jgi:glycosyltransferase involved in cell wall biosynthesis
MRIVMVTETFLPKIDGIVSMICATVESLRARGDEVLVIAPAGGPAELYGARVIGLPSAPFPFYPELRVAVPRASMRRHIKEFQPDVLHLFEPSLLGIGGIYYAQVLHIPLVISYHTNLPAYLRYYRLGFLQGATWKLMQIRHGRADLNLCTSTPMMDELAQHQIDRLALWERAVDAERFHPSRRSAEMRSTLTQGEPHKPLLLFVGRLCAEKNIASLKAILQSIPDLRLAIVGDGPTRAELEKHFRNTPTHFAGYLRGEALAAAFASADLFVMPSETETLGLVLLEAMASGSVVVACRAGGIPDAVEDGVTGFLYEPGLSEPKERGLVETVRRVLAHPAERALVQSRARAEVERHGWQQATDLLRRQYQEAIEHPRPRTTRPANQRSFARRTTLSALRRLLP